MAPMDIDPQAASALGFPKLEYVALERERRWLCREVPRERVVRTPEQMAAFPMPEFAVHEVTDDPRFTAPILCITSIPLKSNLGSGSV